MGLNTSELPMPHKQGICILKRVVVNWQESMVEVHLHSKQRGMVCRRRIEMITLNIVPGMTEQEAVRIAVFVSQSKWIVTWMSPVSQYNQSWNKPLDTRLQAALTDPPKISISLS